MFKGVLLMTSDYNTAYNHTLQGGRVVSLDENNNYSHFVNGFSLLPPYAAVEAMINNDPVMFNTMYGAHLGTAAEEFLVTIITAMYRGHSIMFYMNKDTADTMVPNALIGFMAANYGIFIGTSRLCNPQYDQSFNWINLTRLYLYNYINLKEYLMMYPSKVQKISTLALPKLVMEMPPVLAKTEAELVDHYTNYSIDCQNAGKFLVPMTIGIGRGRVL